MRTVQHMFVLDFGREDNGDEGEHQENAAQPTSGNKQPVVQHAIHATAKLPTPFAMRRKKAVSFQILG